MAQLNDNIVSYIANQDMLQIDANKIARSARHQGLSNEDAILFSQVAMEQIQMLQQQNPDGHGPVLGWDLAAAIKEQAIRESNRRRHGEDQLAAHGIPIADHLEDDPYEISIEEKGTAGQPRKRFKFGQDGLDEFFGGEDPYDISDNLNQLSLRHASRDIITALCQNVEIAVEIGKYLGPKDIVNLYSVSKAFHATINTHMLSSIRSWVSHKAPEAGEVFAFKLYRRVLIQDPMKRSWGDQYKEHQHLIPPHARAGIRLIPGMRYLQLVLGRHRYCREIIAIMARNGHRMPQTMYSTLLRLWIMTEIATSRQRQAYLNCKETWTDQHLYNSQFFFVKLSMHFVDPVYGPISNSLLRIMLGQKGLYPLWQLLMAKKYTSLKEFLKLKMRYDYQPSPEFWRNFSTTPSHDSTLHGVPLHEIGLGHYEGWGVGERHLMRPDELIPIEAIKRGLHLDDHLMDMVVWGYIDFDTGANLVPSEEEMYISDDENVLSHMDTRHHWRRKHVIKKRWSKLTPVQQEEIMDEDEDDRLRAMAFCGGGDDQFEPDEASSQDSDSQEGNYSGWNDEEPFTLDDEIDRGFQLRPYKRELSAQLPDLNDSGGWNFFLRDSLLGMSHDLFADGEEE